MVTENIIAFIPARGSSKRLPGKNIRKMNSFPLIAYSIAFAKSNGIKNIFVSTNDDDIAEVAIKYCVAVIFRPEEISTDFSTSSSAAKHCLEIVRNTNISTKVFATLQPTNPLRPKSLFSDALKKFEECKCDSVISVSLNKHKLGILNKGFYSTSNYQSEMRSQDLPEQYFENGLIYLSKPESILKEGIFGKNIQTVVVDEPYSFSDIDTLFDFELNEYLLKKYASLFSYLNDYL